MRRSLKLSPGLLRQAACALGLAVVLIPVGAQETEFESLADAPAIQQRIDQERQRGNAETAWVLEHGLMGLALRNPEDARSARILRDIGDYRADMLARYEDGELLPEIELGCYYDDSAQQIQAGQRGSRPLYASSTTTRRTCFAGSSSRARRALAAEILWFYVQSARIFLDSEGVDADELRELFMTLLARSYRNLDYPTGRSALEALRAYEETSSANWAVQARVVALMGDWDLVFARHFGTKYRDSAIVEYERAISLLDEHGVADDSIFSPEAPVSLPAFLANPLISERTADSIGYVDIAFEIERDGRVSRTRIVESFGDVPRAAQRDLVNTVERARFRPIAENGRLVESAPVTLRYYFND